MSRSIAGHSLNLHSLHIWYNTTVELTSNVTLHQYYGYIKTTITNHYDVLCQGI